MKFQRNLALLLWRQTRRHPVSVKISSKAIMRRERKLSNHVWKLSKIRFHCRAYKQINGTRLSYSALRNVIPQFWSVRSVATIWKQICWCRHGKTWFLLPDSWGAHCCHQRQLRDYWIFLQNKACIQAAQAIVDYLETRRIHIIDWSVCSLLIPVWKICGDSWLGMEIKVQQFTSAVLELQVVASTLEVTLAWTASRDL